MGGKEGISMQRKHEWEDLMVGGRMEQSDHKLPESRPFFLRNRESSDPSREPRIVLGLWDWVTVPELALQ